MPAKCRTQQHKIISNCFQHREIHQHHHLKIINLLKIKWVTMKGLFSKENAMY